MTLFNNDDEYSPCPSPPSTTMGAMIFLELNKFIFVIVFLINAGLSNWIALAYIHDYVGRTPLPDFIFNYVDQRIWTLKVGDWMAKLSSTLLIILFIIHKQRIIVIRRTLFIIAVLYMFRTFSLLFTQLPSAYSDNNIRCSPQENNTTFEKFLQRIVIQTTNFGFQNIEQQMLCGDLLYSGHTLIMVVCYLTFLQYLPHSWRLFRFVPKIFMIVGMSCMVISRTHYSIDVFFAYCFSVAVFTLYHAYCEIDTYRERENSVLKNLYIIWIVAWLEKNVNPGKLENKFELPFRSFYDKFFNLDTRAKTKQQTNSIVNF